MDHNLSLTRAETREIDHLAQTELGIPGLVLMENAGIGVAHYVMEMLAGSPGPVAVLCGGGSNGGDGYVVARQLANRGIQVRVYSRLPADAMHGDALVNRGIIDRMGLWHPPVSTPGELEAVRAELAEATVMVDALLGTGFQGAVRPQLAGVIQTMMATRAQTGARVISVDVPSGLDCDHGEASNATVQADLTVTFVARKRGFDHPRSKVWTGEVVVMPVGAPDSLVGRVLAASGRV
ncbi:MAG: hydroxyethylthiazole kinase-like uncharacterized protein yjeF [Chlamydiales bacterium]|jgi:hydroxyethylthiazole kinase-like uncharacterized protein yjeF